MAKDETRRIRPSELIADRNAFSALQTINGYTPANPAYAITDINSAQIAMEAAQTAEAQAQAALDAARDNAVAKEWAFHNKILGAKDQVIAQFGDDSNEVQALGLKKKSEYKRPGKSTGGNTP